MEEEVKLTYRGRAISAADVTFINELIAAHPDASRFKLSVLLCEAWNWVQPNGQLRDMVCRGLMLALYRAKLIKLPSPRATVRNPLVFRKKPAPVHVDTTPLRATVAELRPLDFRLVRRTREEPIFNGLMEEHHYLGYVQPVGEHLKYLVYAHGRVVACLAWCSAPRHLGPRDRFIGWTPEYRKKNIRFLAYNTRYLLLPWVHAKCLASHILGCMARRLPHDWDAVYGHPVYFLETFVDPARNRGTCYLAANWVPLGRTTGRGHNAPTKKPRVPVKEILGYPLVRDFRTRLSGVS